MTWYEFNCMDSQPTNCMMPRKFDTTECRFPVYTG